MEAPPCLAAITAYAKPPMAERPDSTPPMKLIRIIWTSLLLAVTATAADKPNVILILADDLGYETIGADGGTSYKTPVIDKLAAAWILQAALDSLR